MFYLFEDLFSFINAAKNIIKNKELLTRGYYDEGMTEHFEEKNSRTNKKRNI